jgi:hypothetical protein
MGIWREITSMNIMRRSLMIFMLGLLAAGCIGRATPPEQVKLTQAQNEVLGKFARRVGEAELNILLRNPNDTTLPGIPVGDLLYILAKVNEDKLITLVKGIGATYTLELILAIKRVGCTRANTVPVASGYGFDATSVASLNTCTWSHYHLPNIMVQLLNGASTQGMTTLIDTVRHSFTNLNLTCASNGSGVLAANQSLCPSTTAGAANPDNNAPYDSTVEHYAYFMKLAYIVAGFDTPTLADPNLASENLIGPPKLYGLMNLTRDGRDMVFLLDSFDKNACPGVASTTSNCVYVDNTNVLTTYAAGGDLWLDLAADNQMQGIKNLLNVISQVTDTTKMGTLLNGRRTTAADRYNVSLDDGQIRYFTDRLRPVIEHRAPAACTAASFPGTAAEQAMQFYGTPHGGSGAWNTKLASIINNVVNVDRMMDLIYNIEDGYDINHNLTIACPNRGIDNLMVLLNNINNTDPHNAPNTTNNEVVTAAYLIDNVTLFPTDADPRRRNKVKYLVEFMGTTLDVLQLACHTSVADHVDGVAPADATPDTCDNRGLINQVADGSKVDDAAVTDLTAAGRKLANLADQINEIEDMRFLVRKVSMSNMTQIINGLQIASTINVANLVNQIQGVDCWNENGGLIAPTVANPAPAGTYSGNFAINPVATGGNNAFVKAIVETDATNHAAFVGRVRNFVVIGSGTGYATTSNFAVAGGSQISFLGGNCNYNPPTAYRGIPTAGATGATGLGKMVNVINHITGSPGTIVTLINGVTDGNKLGILINGISRSSNLVGVVNATVDASRNNNATINDLINLMNTLSREDVLKLVHMLENLGDAREIDAQLTVPGGDHDMVSQLLAPYNSASIQTTSGLGTAAMADLIAALRYSGGSGFPAAGGNVSIGAVAVAAYTTTTDGLVSGIQMVNHGATCTSAPTVSITGGGGSGATANAVYDSGAQQVSRVAITNAGTGYTSNPTVTFAGGGCGTTPTANAFINRVGSVAINSPAPALAGSQNCDSLGTTTPYCVASGAASTLRSFYGGTGYTTGDICPIVGAGGAGGTCTVTAVAGALTGCSAIGGGSNYADERIVKIGGRAEAAVTVSGGIVTGVSVTNSGCGYAGVPAVQVVGCTVAPVLTATVIAGRVTAITGFPSGTGCPVGAKVVIGENPFVNFADGASAIVDTITGGRLTFVSTSEASVNAAQLIQLIDRDATGITSGTRGFSITYNGTTPNISAREAMVRLLHHGVTIPAASSKGYFSENFGSGSVVDIASDGLTDNLKSGVALGGAGIWTNAYAVNLPGLGPQHIAGSILNNLSGVAPTQTLINMVNTNTIDLTDTLLLLGCGDRSTYSNIAASPFSWQQICAQIGPGLW